ncbi:kinase-like domain-containing protein [Xylaria scruposa]|nr:kinase-like domain-containing protein [Xylaria scruposa]
MDATATDHSALSTSVVRGTDVDHLKIIDLLDDVDTLLRKKCHPQNDIRGFLARGDITTILTERVIWDILSQNQSLALTEDELNEIVGQVFNKDLEKRMIEIFAILIFTGKVEYIQELVRSGINDKQLPLVPQEWYERLDFWQKSQVDDFCCRQWLVHIPILNFATDNTEIVKYKEEQRMPFVYERGIGRGGQGENTTFALKRVFSASKWNNEVKALNRFREANLEHQHLIRLLFAYEHKGKGFYMVFPLARGDLNHYWEKNTSQVPSYETLRWLIQQCTGIAAALKKIHCLDSLDQKLGRHGDIKPSNILWFEDTKHVRGLLVVSDLTMARFHSIDTVNNSTSALHRDLSMTYRPPEIDLELKRGLSQAYDVWSLGCVFFEFVVWYLVGYNAINHEKGFLNDQQKCLSFRYARLQDDNSRNGRYDDKFFNTSNTKSGDGCNTAAVVKESVHMWARFLHASNNCSKVLHDFLILIMTRMLVIEPRERISIEQPARKRRTGYFYTGKQQFGWKITGNEAILEMQALGAEN